MLAFELPHAFLQALFGRRGTIAHVFDLAFQQSFWCFPELHWKSATAGATQAFEPRRSWF